MDTRGANRTFNLDLPLLLFLLFSLLSPTCLAQNTRSGVGNAERYWDCCKPDCAWPERGPLNQPIRTCSAEGEPHTDANLGSACGGGPSYPCSDQSPWAINDTLSYGFAGVFLMGRAADSWCCACYELTFTSGKVVGKKMIVQAHNSGFDLLTTNRFALAVPGGNTSYVGACAQQFGVDNSVFGKDNVGVASVEDCDNLPEPHRPGCRWRFEWFEDEAGPSLNYTRVRCPAELTERTGCIRTDEDSIDEPGAAPTVSTGFSTLTMTVLVALAFGGMTLISY